MDLIQKKDLCNIIEQKILYLIKNNDISLYNELYDLSELLGKTIGIKQPYKQKSTEYLINLSQWIGYVKSIIDNKNILPKCNVSNINIDIDFNNLMNFIKYNNVNDIENYMSNEFKKISYSNRKIIYDYTIKYPLWGDIELESGKGSMVNERANCIKEHRDDFIWLYNRLCDYRSRYVLYAILKYWLNYDFETLEKSKEFLFNDYFDLDILILNENDVVADVGAFVGDTANTFANVYVNCKKMYCYEIDSNNIEKAKYICDRFSFIEYRQKAVSDKNGKIYIDFNYEDSSSNKINENGDVLVEAVTLDSDIKEPLSFIKMDIEGSEQKALQGCVNHIKNHKTKLAICTYHNNEDIWKIPRMIDNIRDDYKFYMRYNGGNLFPTEYVFFAL